MFVTTPASPDLLLAASSAWTCYSANASTPIAVLQWARFIASLGPLQDLVQVHGEPCRR